METFARCAVVAHALGGNASRRAAVLGPSLRLSHPSCRAQADGARNSPRLDGGTARRARFGEDTVAGAHAPCVEPSGAGAGGAVRKVAHRTSGRGAGFAERGCLGRLDGRASRCGVVDPRRCEGRTHFLGRFSPASSGGDPGREPVRSLWRTVQDLADVGRGRRGASAGSLTRRVERLMAWRRGGRAFGTGKGTGSAMPGDALRTSRSLRNGGSGAVHHLVG